VSAGVLDRGVERNVLTSGTAARQMAVAGAAFHVVPVEGVAARTVDQILHTRPLSLAGVGIRARANGIIDAILPPRREQFSTLSYLNSGWFTALASLPSRRRSIRGFRIFAEE
jgi:hypothetical protein